MGFLMVCSVCGCKKYLDERSNKQLVVAKSIQDAQSLLDDYQGMNVIAILANGNVMDDNFYLTDTYYARVSAAYKYEILWDKNATVIDAAWQQVYLHILNCNIALETLNKITPNATNINAYNQAKGGAYFFRAFSHYQVALVFSAQYNSSTASTDLGIPYKTTSDINDKTTRFSVKDSYNMIIADLLSAADLLPPIASPISRPNKYCCYGMLARVYLSMNDYTNALKFADLCLSANSTLLDYNILNSNTNTSPFPKFGLNPEELFHSISGGIGALNYPNWNCDSTLYASYDDNDLRKVLFFRKNTNGSNSYSFKGTYDPTFGPAYPYSGIANDELYLIRAECYARQSNVQAAMADLNSLLITRWKTGTFVPFTAANADDALNQILKERRKELVARCNLRWADLKRLNLDSQHAVTLTRVQNGVTYTLPPNDPRYALLIPQTVIQDSGIPQNPR